MSGNINDTNPSKLGGGVPGVQPALLGGGGGHFGGSGMVGTSVRARNRFIMRTAAGRYMPIAAKAGINVTDLELKSSLTPFRVALNAGDLRGSVNSAPAPGMWNANQLGGVGDMRSMVLELAMELVMETHYTVEILDTYMILLITFDLKS